MKNKLNKLQIHLCSVIEHCKNKSVSLSRFQKLMFSSFAIFIFVIFASLIVSGILNAYPYTPAGGATVTSTAGIPTNSVVAFNQASCPAGWVLADGTSGTPDLRGIFIRGAGTNSIINYANGTDMSATYGQYQNDSFQGHWHEFSYNVLGAASSETPFGGTGAYIGGTYMTHTDSAISDGTNGQPRNGSETRPASYALIYCVKATEDTTSSNSIWQTLSGIVQLVNTSNSVQIRTLNVTGNLSVNGQVNIDGNSKVRVTKNDTQTIATDTETKIQYDDEEYDTLSEYNSSYSFVAKNSGYYDVKASVLTDNVAWTADQVITLSIYKNGVLSSHLDRKTIEASGTRFIKFAGSDIVYLNVGDYVEIYFVHTRGANTNTHTNLDYNFFSVHRIS